ncbi:hypothetical protein BDQ17DRAFT_827051 [Cyathus striatus]|nr:hypothetical protein BDQ17DRAFT_827051 [Cyathus striatus]
MFCKLLNTCCLLFSRPLLDFSAYAAHVPLYTIIDHYRNSSKYTVPFVTSASKHWNALRPTMQKITKSCLRFSS